jgi:hypothetical protein
VAFKIKRYRTKQEVLVTVLFGLVLNFVSDLYLDLKYHLYWYFDKQQVDWSYLIVAIGQVGVLFIIFNYFPVKSRAFVKLLYFFIWTGILVLLESFAVRIEVLHYGNWNQFYSAVVYFISLYLLYFILKFTAARRESW